MTSSNIERASPMPGPWELGDWITSMGDNVYRIIYSGKRAVSAISVYGRRPDGSQGGRKKKNGGYAPCVSTPECEATARLIAAAPELLDALLKARTDMLRTDFKSYAAQAGYMRKYITDALNKAGVE